MTHQRSRLLPVFIGLILLLPGIHARERHPAPEDAKIHSMVLDQASGGTPIPCLLVLRAQADLSETAGLLEKTAKGRFAYDELTRVSAETQGPLLDALRARGIPHRSFWIVNAVLIEGDSGVIAWAAERPEVMRILPDPLIAAPLPRQGETESGGASPLAVEWNVTQIGAPSVWGLGYTGQDVVIGGCDTGYDWDHPALIDHYRGWTGSSADHDYAWHDAVHSGGGSCGPDSPEPCDDYGHGTHTMGTMAGDDGDANQIGVAPGARWIGCRNMNVGYGSPSTYIECLEWFLAPTDLNGENPDPSKAPHVINNSWACPPSEGCSHDTLQSAIENVRAAGIVVVASAGNDGSSCSTVQYPPAIYDASFSVGATDSADDIASLSSRGPVTADGSGRLKPDVTAPGVSVRSCVVGTGYGYKSGTSMAGPHAAGAVALLLSARPDLAGDVDTVEGILKATAVPLTTTQDCGTIPGDQVPNNTYGFGRLDAYEAAAGDPDGDAVSTLTDCKPLDGDLWSAPGPAEDLMLQGHQPTHLSWNAPSSPGGIDSSYDVLRTSAASDFSSPDCVASGTSQDWIDDPDAIAENGIYYYIIRVSNACGEALGNDSSGTPRTAGDCP